jgi:hypothetical protein
VAGRLRFPNTTSLSHANPLAPRAFQAVMKLAIIVLTLTVATAAAATPAPKSLAKAFGNTVVSTYPDGRTALLWLKPDGTYSAKGRHRTPSSGAWALKGQELCLSQHKPFGAPFAYCTPLPASTSWTAKAVTGESIKVRIVSGTAIS